MLKIYSIIIFANLLIFNCLAQNTKIEAKILALIKPFNGKVGVSIKNIKTHEQININGTDKYPMQSVYKLPLAMAVLDQIDKGKYNLDQKMNLGKSDLWPDTHSPLRDKYPNGKADITLKEILEKTVSESDNNGCDYLFRLLGGCSKVDKFIRKHQPEGINIVYTEHEMQSDSTFQYINYAKPDAMNILLEKFYKGKILSSNSTAALWKMLIETVTAPNRIKGKLPEGTIVGHKSGWSGGDDKGFTNAINDTGIVILPNGTAFAITIFIKNTYEKSDKSDALGAKICKLVYDHFNSPKGR
jgi:beta-lactamase class A